MDRIASVTIDRQTSGATNHRVAACAGLVLVAIAAVLALTDEVPRTGPDLRGVIKGDEATYVAAALSAAFDGDLYFERRDLERFERLYHSGPEGIFLQRGRRLRTEVANSFPFVRVTGTPDSRPDRLYFGKALLYPVAAAPFVRLFGLNGLLLFHVLLLSSVAACGYLFLAAHTSSTAAMLFSLAFLGASVLPAYSELLAPEILNFTLVFVAYFLWLYKQVSANPRFAGPWPEVVAAGLLGLVTYSKPTNALLIAPLVLSAWRHRQWTRGLVLSGVFLAVVGAGFAFSAAVSGEFNYQGGDRKTFYRSFPFDGSGSAWEANRATAATDGSAARAVLTSPEAPARLATNIKYFLVGRHFGFIPYFFPGAVAIVVWLLSSARWDVRRMLTFGAFVASAIGLLLLMPYTWSGGGGPIGNRYFLSVYPVLFFLMPPVDMLRPALIAWLGGALFTAKILVNPAAAATRPYLIAEHGPARLLPVELTMANDLPLALAQPRRARIPYGENPTMLLYFLDRNAFPPEQSGVWVSGMGRADIIVRANQQIDHLAMSAESPIRTVLRVKMGGRPISVPLEPGQMAKFNLPARGVRELYGYAYLLSATSSEGFVPALHEPSSSDQRHLSALLRFSAVPVATP